MNTTRTITVFMTLLSAACLTAAGDSTLTPRGQIPKLPEFFDLVDYKQVFSNGTLLPDSGVAHSLLWVR